MSYRSTTYRRKSNPTAMLAMAGITAVIFLVAGFYVALTPHGAFGATAQETAGFSIRIEPSASGEALVTLRNQSGFDADFELRLDGRHQRWYTVHSGAKSRIILLRDLLPGTKITFNPPADGPPVSAKIPKQARRYTAHIVSNAKSSPPETVVNVRNRTASQEVEFAVSAADISAIIGPASYGTGKVKLGSLSRGVIVTVTVTPPGKTRPITLDLCKVNRTGMC